MAHPMNEAILQEYFLADGAVVRTKTGEVQPFTVRKDGYRYCYINRKTAYLHRVLWVLHNGGIPSGMEIDHINGDPSDNRIENLRLCGRSENCQNTKVRSDNSSGFKGVFWDKHSRSWRASVWKDKKKHDLGRFGFLSEAAMVAAKARAEIHGKFANQGLHSRGVV